MFVGTFLLRITHTKFHKVVQIPSESPCILRFKEKEKRAAVVAKATVHKQGSVQRFEFAGRLEFFSRSVGYIRISPECFPVNLNFWLIWLEKKSRKRHSVQESYFCSRKFGTDTWKFARQPTVPVQNFQASNQLHRAGSVQRSCWKTEGLHIGKTNVNICGVWKKFKIRL